MAGLDGAWLEPITRAAAARRIAFTGTPTGTPSADVWSHPFRLMHRLAVSGRMVAAGAALELPLAVWTLAADTHGIPASADWVVDLRRPWPEAKGDALVASLSADETRLLVAATGAPSRALFVVRGGRFRYEHRADGMHVTVTGAQDLTLVAIGATDGADLDRTIGLLARRGLAGLARQRVQHDEQLARGGASIAGPGQEVRAAQFEAAKLAADAELAELPGMGRAPLARRADDAHPRPGVFRTRDGCRTALGLLAAGLREPARDTLRFLARLADAGGTLPPEVSAGGVVEGGGLEGTRAFIHLANRHYAWTADASIRDELASVLARAEGWAGGIDRVEPAFIGSDGPGELLLEVIAREWGIDPDAPNGAVRIAPGLPAHGTRTGLSRLRIGRTVLDLRLAHRGATVQLSVRKVMGPPLIVDGEVPGLRAEAAELDGVALGGSRARFEATGEHELLLHAGG